jgi:hypothetical protein
LASISHDRAAGLTQEPGFRVATRWVGIALLLAGVGVEQVCLLAILEWHTWGVLLFTTVCVLGGLIAHGPKFVRWIDTSAPPEK